jgi:hypothetical protein
MMATQRNPGVQAQPMYEGIDTVVLHDELAFHDQLPLEWQARADGFDNFTLSGFDDTNIALLHACVLADEQPVRDKNEELVPLANELARLDHKLNLVLQLLGTLMPKSPPTARSEVRFNTLGASFHASASTPAIGASGLLRIHLRSALPEALNFACEVTAVSGNEVSVRYLRMSERCAELIQRLSFLKHRRDVADARKSRVL